MKKKHAKWQHFMAHTLCNVGLFLDQYINKLKHQQQFKHQIHTWESILGSLAQQYDAFHLCHRANWLNALIRSYLDF